nr:AMP-binding protein [Streptomyces sp. I6]
MYTSGSTGRPKGVMVEHRGIAHQMRWLARTYGLGPSSTVLQKTPMSFDAAQWEILAPCLGSRIVPAAPGAYRDPGALLDTVARHGVTVLQCVPTLLQALLDTDRLPDCDSLTQVFCGGEALSRRLAQRFTETLHKCELVNLYGPTECTVNASAHTVDPSSVADGPSGVPIGTPVDGLAFHVLDERMRPVAPGAVGELYISGVQVARGYRHRPDLTAERFLDNPFSADPAHAVLYRTGDRAHREGGTYRFDGRVDRQVKLRGYRVEPDEIRLAIEAHDWVRNAAVLVKDDPATGHRNLVACVELSPREAALMDQGSHDRHHVSKTGRLQVRAQLSDGGCRDAAELAGRLRVDLPARTPTDEQCRRVFARKTYRFYEGGVTRPDELLDLLAARTPGAAPKRPEQLRAAELGAVLRYFGQYTSDERLLPKYGYASPGSLYAAQLYLEVTGPDGCAGLAPGHWYYHPVEHRLYLIEAGSGGDGGDERPGIRFHFAGRRGRSHRCTAPTSRRSWRSRPGTWSACSRRCSPRTVWTSPRPRTRPARCAVCTAPRRTTTWGPSIWSRTAPTARRCPWTCICRSTPAGCPAWRPASTTTPAARWSGSRTSWCSSGM